MHSFNKGCFFLIVQTGQVSEIVLETILFLEACGNRKNGLPFLGNENMFESI